MNETQEDEKDVMRDGEQDEGKGRLRNHFPMNTLKHAHERSIQTFAKRLS